MYNIIPLDAFPTATGAELDLRAMAQWAACGFFWGSDSFWQDVSWQRPAVDGPLWCHEPRDRSLDAVVDEFADCFERIVQEQVRGQRVILPLSGGLDSRTLAVALWRLGADTRGFSYSFPGGHAETAYGQQLADIAGWPFQAYTIPQGYLWDRIEAAADINHCYAEFTHPRQVAVAAQAAELGDCWALGHWGDVLFDDMGVAAGLPIEGRKQALKKKVLRAGGLELAIELWAAWGLEGSFSQALDQRLDGIAGVRIRAHDFHLGAGMHIGGF